MAPGSSQEVVGESYRQGDIDQIAGGKTPEGARNRHHIAQLVPEPSNPEDRQAIRVEIGGVLVGYIPRSETNRYHALIAHLHGQGRPATCAATIIGGWDLGGGDQGHFGVLLDVADPPEPTDPLRHPLIHSARRVALVGEQHRQPHLGELLTLQSSGASLLAVLGLDGDTVVATSHGQPIGDLSPVMCDRYRPMIAEILSRGIEPTCLASVEQGARKIEAHVYLWSPVG